MSDPQLLSALLAKHSMTARREAIAEADAHTNNAGLPTYSELVDALRKQQNVLAGIACGDLKTLRPDSPALLAGRALLSRIPS